MGEIIQDIRIISLYKQHYFDNYAPNMHTDYSCWGYYDGISITQVDTSDDKKNISHLFEKRSNACISPVWCGTAHSADDLNGTYSKQSIGIFRCFDSSANITWEKNSKIEKMSPYFALAFLQLALPEQYADIEQKIEGMSVYSCDAYNDYDTSLPYVFFNTYHTYDNADLIILLYSNNLKQMNAALTDVETDERIRYMHSIMGVSENYLNDCRNQILPEWHGVNCFIDDDIPYVSMNVSTSGSPDVVEKIKYQFRHPSKNLNVRFKGWDSITFSHGTGHCNLRIDIHATDTKSILSMLTEDGISTHDNPLYGNSIYNIETTLFWEPVNIKRINEIAVPPKPDIEPDESDSKEGGWFSQLTQTYRKKMDEAWGRQDEGGFSYYYALTQVCNILSQYEGFALSKDIFLLLYPSFRMFDIQLRQAELLVSEKNPSGDRQDLNDSICEFVNAVNSLVYHTIHTDQIFLMIPGYSGTTFSIPVKLCLIYMWVIRAVTGLLNDAHYNYACLLTPELETRPTTTVIRMGMNTDNRLIRFSSSQRSLYMPRHFIILITHELAHYVGKSIRDRHLRTQCLARILAHLLAEGIFPEEYGLLAQKSPNMIKQKLYRILEKEVKNKIQIYCVTAIYEKINNNPNPQKEHATNVIPALKEICYELLGEKGIIYQYIYSIPSGIKEEFSNTDFIEAMDLLCEAQNRLDYNRRVLFASRNIIGACINELMQIFGEVFSDIAAFGILNLDQTTFSEVFNVSEGNVPDSESDIQRNVREWIIKRLSEKDFTEPLSKYKNENFDQTDMTNWPASIKDHLFNYYWVGKYLWDYASSSFAMINKQIEKNDTLKNKVSELYNLFASGDPSCSYIYNKIVTVIKEYAQDITNEYESDLKFKL